MSQNIKNDKIIADGKNKKRDYTLDLMKCIAIFFVILYHAGTFSNGGVIGENVNFSNYIKYFLRAFLPVCVPIFFFVNGYLLFNKELDMKKHIIKIVKLIVFTILWAIASYVIVSLLKNTKMNLKDMLNSISFLKQGYNNHLWFLGTLVILYIFYPLLKQAYDNNKKIFYFFFVVIFIMTIGNKLINYIYNIICIVIHKNDMDYINIFRIFNPVLGIYGHSIVYFMLGGIISNYKEKLNNKKIKILAPIVFIISAFLLFLYWLTMSRANQKTYDYVFGSYDTIFTMINVLCIYIMCLSYKENKFSNYLIKLIGSNTMGIYLIHTIVINLFWFFKVNIKESSITEILISIATLIISTIITVLVKKVKGLRKIVSI